MFFLFCHNEILHGQRDNLSVSPCIIRFEEGYQTMSAEIWAIGGGKGGTGKSFVTSNLGIDLAAGGKKVILIDGDLGGANLHTFFGQKKPKNSLTEFFEKKLPLNEILCKTQVPNLGLIIGDVHTFNPQGIKYAQKLRLFRHIKNLDADYVLVDLGAGSGLNIIDTHLLADKMIVVSLPEITSIENLYLFLKRAVFRKLNVIMRKHQLKEQALSAWKRINQDEVRSIGELIKQLKEVSPEIKRVVEIELLNFQVYLVLNQVRNQDHLAMGASIRSVIIKYFGIDARFVGYVNFRDDFWKFINQANPFAEMAEPNPMTETFNKISRNIMNGQQVSFANIPNV